MLVMMIFWMESGPLDPPRDYSAITSHVTDHVILNVAMAARRPMKRVEYTVSIVTGITVEARATTSPGTLVIHNSMHSIGTSICFVFLKM